MLEHGGRLRQAAAQSGIALADWLDLSTGINPWPYPVPPVPTAAWHRLPEDDDGLEAAAARYYGSTELLPVAGSQPAIQALPALLPGARVTLLDPTYAEHPHAWRGRRLRRCTADEIDSAVDDTDVLVLVHPNNPSGARFEPAQLRAWHARLAARGGWLVADEAFIDSEPAASLAALAGTPGLVVLRSLGKFFGLAGARVGFVLAPAAVRAALADALGPWTLSGPARHAARCALEDTAWQARMRGRLADAGERLHRLLDHHGFLDCRGPALFKWTPHPQAAELHHTLAADGILVRLFDAPSSLRFGLPATEADWQRLATALHELRPLIERR